MTKYDFDNLPQRRGSGSYKWDTPAPGGADSRDMIPLWVADMDFPTAPVIIEALQRRVAHGVFGYTLVGPEYYAALTGWFRGRHGYEIDPARVIYTPGVVPAISAIIQGLCKEGDGVIVQTPVYNCFFSSIRNSGCKRLDAPLKVKRLEGGLFTYEMDFEALEREASRPGAKLMLLCNPHNPAGRVWRRDELRHVAEICRRHGVRVVSDEIHCELTWPGTDYVPYGTIDSEAIVCVSPSKAFNTAGLQIANIVCPDAEVQQAVDRAVNINEVCDVNPFGVEGLKAAYTPEGAEWLDALRRYLWENYNAFVGRWLRDMPGCPVTKLEGTYLVWVDVRALGLPAEQLEEQLAREAAVWVNCGDMYGDDGYIRINLATSRSLLMEGVDRIIKWCKAR